MSSDPKTGPEAEKKTPYFGYPKYAPPLTHLDGPDSGPAYGADVLPGETVKQYRERKEREASEQPMYSVTGMLTHSELERLKQLAREAIEHGNKTFAHLRPKKA